MIKPKLSVIIPCLNSGATLAEQMEALASQTWSEKWEVIVSDNGSTDDSVSVALQYKHRFSAFQIVEALDRKGASHARNKGAIAANADRLAFCDADDEAAPGWVASIGDSLGNRDVVYGQFAFDKYNTPRQAELMARNWRDGLYKGRFLPGGGAGNLGVRRRVHEAIGGFDECLPHSEDADYYWRLQLEGFGLHYVPEAIVQVRMGRVNPSLPYLFHRSRKRTASNYWCYKRYRSYGMLPPPSSQKAICSCFHDLKMLMKSTVKFRINRSRHLKSLVSQAGIIIGEIQGKATSPCKPFHPTQKAHLMDVSVNKEKS